MLKKVYIELCDFNLDNNHNIINIIDEDFNIHISQQDQFYQKFPFNTLNRKMLIAIEAIISYYSSKNLNVEKNIFQLLSYFSQTFNKSFDEQIELYSKYSSNFLEYLPKVKKYLLLL